MTGDKATPADVARLRASADDLRRAAGHAAKPYRRPFRRFAAEFDAAADEILALRSHHYESTERAVCAAVDKWDEERHMEGTRGSMGRLLFYIQEELHG